MKKIATALLMISGSTLVGGALAQMPGASNVYFLDKSVSGAVSVWVDGHKVFASEFANTPDMFSRPVSPGRHSVVVTPFYARPGQKDIAQAALDFKPGIYTLNLGNVPSNRALFGSAFRTNALYMTQGAPN